MKKSCHITSVHQLFDVRIFQKECRTLVKAGYDVSLIVENEKDEIIDCIRILALSKSKNRVHRIFIRNLEIFWLALKQKADIFHFHDPELLPFGMLIKLFTGKKIIYDAHEDVSKSILSRNWLPKIFRKIASILISLFENTISKRFDYIITSTPEIKSKFGNYKVVDIKNYPIIKKHGLVFKRNKTTKRSEYNLIYIGGLEKIRGIKEIIRSLGFVNPKYNIKLTLLGKFSEIAFENEVKRLKEWDKVDFFGFVPSNRVIEYLLYADIGLVCLYPIERFLTSLPVKMFEYMAVGLPIIASNFPLWKKIIRINNCGLNVNPLNIREIAQAIEFLIEHPNEAKKMRENGRKAVLEKYNWAKESKKLITVYRKLMNNEKID